MDKEKGWCRIDGQKVPPLPVRVLSPDVNELSTTPPREIPLRRPAEGFRTHLWKFRSNTPLATTRQSILAEDLKEIPTVIGTLAEASDSWASRVSSSDQPSDRNAKLFHIFFACAPEMRLFWRLGFLLFRTVPQHIYSCIPNTPKTNPASNRANRRSHRK